MSEQSLAFLRQTAVLLPLFPKLPCYPFANLRFYLLLTGRPCASMTENHTDLPRLVFPKAFWHIRPCIRLTVGLEFALMLVELFHSWYKRNNSARLNTWREGRGDSWPRERDGFKSLRSPESPLHTRHNGKGA